MTESELRLLREQFEKVFHYLDDAWSGSKAEYIDQRTSSYFHAFMVGYSCK
jgi:hypothetical protein